jgi:putative RNA 2'-phosphotransferase
MPEEIRTCGQHGYFEGIQCPICDDSGRSLLSGNRRRRLSKFFSGALRHFPEDAGIELDGEGWADQSAVTRAVERKYDWADSHTLEGVIVTDPKGRFERDGDRIRAAYGHSVDVELVDDDGPVPDTLYHGTAPRNLDPIFNDGLKPMNRQHVHLSETVTAARDVGSRHADEPVVLVVDAAAMERDGRTITKRGKATYTTAVVPPEYLSRLSG